MSTKWRLVPCSIVLYNRAMQLSASVVLIGLIGCLAPLMPAAAEGRTSSGPVGASMAVLATLQDADVLPPEGTPEANQLVHIVIQMQSLFMKSDNPAVRGFFDEAVKAKWGEAGATRAAAFRSGGWTSEIIEAVSLQYDREPEQNLKELATGFSQFNVRLADFELFSGLFRKAQARFIERGQDIHRVFYNHRRTMPGGRWDDRKERPNGNQGVYPHQS